MLRGSHDSSFALVVVIFVLSVLVVVFVGDGSEDGINNNNNNNNSNNNNNCIIVFAAVLLLPMMILMMLLLASLVAFRATVSYSVFATDFVSVSSFDVVNATSLFVLIVYFAAARIFVAAHRKLRK